MSAEPKIMRRAVWSKAIRLGHGLLAITTLALMVTGWLIANTPSVAQIASDYHHIIAALFAVSLGFRLLVLFTDSGAGQWRNMLKSWPSWGYAKKMGLFYLSFGRSELPKWFAHNFVWIPLYFALLLALVLQTLIGIVMIYPVPLFNLYPPDLHSWLAGFIFYWSVFHLYAVVLHDLKSRSADISAMISGYRYFEVDLSRGSDVSASVSINVPDIK